MKLTALQGYTFSHAITRSTATPHQRGCSHALTNAYEIGHGGLALPSMGWHHLAPMGVKQESDDAL